MKYKYIAVAAIIVFSLFIKANAYDGNSVDMGKKYIISAIDDELGSEFDSEQILNLLSAGDFKSAFHAVTAYGMQRLKMLINNRNNIMSTIFAILAVSSLASLAETGGMSKNCSAVLCVSASAVLVKLYMNIYSVAAQTVSSVFSVMRVALPIFIGVSAASGKAASTAVTDSVFVGFTVGFDYLCKLLMPLISVAAAIAAVTSLGFRCESLGKLVINAVNWILGICCVVFTALLKLTAAGANDIDHLTLNGIKYAIAHGIPVIGGFVSDSASAVIGAALVLRSSLGLLTAAVLCVICAVPCIYILLCSLVLRLLAAVCSSFSPGGAAALADSFAACISELGVILLAVCLSFIIGISVMLSSGV